MKQATRKLGNSARKRLLREQRRDRVQQRARLRHELRGTPNNGT